ncbi:hypothetical protein GCM10027034_08420 [Ramlibacter solisilvae]|uniref:hypothetical protein n=1 Tax=Ramlibacter tataouinensis TaxID=94132 RepID=UPI000777B46A|nr:hypothetical protein [Ramlibacter tataouinensis]
MHQFLNLLLRACLLAAGLVFGAALAVAFATLLTLSLLRAGWVRLTGRPAAPLVMRMRPGAPFADMFRRAPQAGPAPHPHPFRPGSGRADVTDVEARELR